MAAAPAAGAGAAAKAAPANADAKAPASALLAPECFAGVPTQTGHTDGTGAGARFSEAYKCVFGPPNADPKFRGKLVVSDNGNGLLRTVDPVTAEVATVVCGAMTFPTIDALTFTSSGALLIGTRTAVWRVGSTAAAPELIAGHPSNAGRVSSTLLHSRFSGVSGIACAADEQLIYVTDWGDNSVRVIDRAANWVRHLAGGEDAQYCGAAPAALAYLPEPANIMFDPLASPPETGLIFTSAGTIRWLNLRTGHVDTIGPAKDGAIGLSVAPNGDLLSAHEVQPLVTQLRVRNMRTGEQRVLSAVGAQRPYGIACDAKQKALFACDASAHV